jgi:hypothetical protein
MHSGSLEEDIPTLLSRPELLKPCIDLAMENILCHSLSIVEVGASAAECMNTFFHGLQHS